MPLFGKSKKKQKEKEESKQQNPNSGIVVPQSQSHVINKYGSTITTTTTRTTTVVHRQINQGGSLRLPHGRYSEGILYTHKPNIASRYSDGKEHYIVTDAQPTRKPIPQEMYDPQKYGLKPYPSPYVKPSNNQPNNVPNYAAAPPKPTTLQVPVRARSHSTSYQPPMFFKTQGNSVTSLPEAIKEEKPLKIQVNKSRQVMKSINSMLELYSTTSKNRGFLFMINNISYTSNNTPRAGAEIDEKNLIELFKQMDFKIDKHTNKKSLDMKKLITNHRKQSSLSKYDISVVILMGHGTGSTSGSSEIAGIDNRNVEISWIIDEFNKTNCPALSGKPKIFIFQCCRGSDVQKDAVPFIPREYSDMLIAYSTIPGFVSYRSPKSGSWYIEHLCKVFMEHACDTDVETLLKLVDSQLAKTKMIGERQTSNFENRGFNKLCYLNPGATK